MTRWARLWVSGKGVQTARGLWQGLQKDAVYFYGGVAEAERALLDPVATAFNEVIAAGNTLNNNMHEYDSVAEDYDTYSGDFSNVTQGAGYWANLSVGGTVAGTGDGPLSLQADTSLSIQVDADDDGGESVQFKDGAGVVFAVVVRSSDCSGK